MALASSALSQTDIRIDDNPSITVADMNAKCRRLDNLGLVIIDYLQLMTAVPATAKNSDNRVTVVGEISRALKIMAKELNVPVICLSQLSRANGKPHRQAARCCPTSGNPAPSSRTPTRSCSSTGTNIIIENTEDKNVAECIVAKNRHGETGAVKLQWIAQYQTFADREWKHAE